MTPEIRNTGNALRPLFQPALFGLSEIPRVVVERTPAQPKKQPVLPMTEARIKGYLDLQQKGELYVWLKGLKFERDEVISQDEANVIGQYLVPQADGHWPSQEEVCQRLGLPKGNPGTVRERALSGLVKICRREVYGETAIETLRLPANFYKALVAAGVCKLEDFSRLNGRIIKQICPSRQDLRTLQDLLLDRDYLWNPDVEY